MWLHWSWWRKFAKIAAKFANKAEPKTLNRVTGIVLSLIGMVVLVVNFIKL